jgi:hypothetical protein
MCVLTSSQQIIIDLLLHSSKLCTCMQWMLCLSSNFCCFCYLFNNCSKTFAMMQALGHNTLMIHFVEALVLQEFVDYVSCTYVKCHRLQHMILFSNTCNMNMRVFHACQYIVVLH